MEEWEELIFASKKYIEAYEKLIGIGRENEVFNESQNKVMGLLITFKDNNVSSVKNSLHWLESTR